jgi:hypothetical protein
MDGLCNLRPNPEKGNRIYAESGAGKRIRTSDPRITNALLYQLSYSGRGKRQGAKYTQN